MSEWDGTSLWQGRFPWRWHCCRADRTGRYFQCFLAGGTVVGFLLCLEAPMAFVHSVWFCAMIVVKGRVLQTSWWAGRCWQTHSSLARGTQPVEGCGATKSCTTHPVISLLALYVHGGSLPVVLQSPEGNLRCCNLQAARDIPKSEIICGQNKGIYFWGSTEANMAFGILHG